MSKCISVNISMLLPVYQERQRRGVCELIIRLLKTLNRQVRVSAAGYLHLPGKREPENGGTKFLRNKQN
jgi:hypothetical protein